ncbi:MAG: ABC transporter, partial [Alkalinema sp. CAN_BIN05]|nr:ABC transporter [Alkalinema sp. CAN_BIN05]
VQATPIALTNKQSWGESNLQEKPIKLNEGDRPGPLPLAVALMRQVILKPIQPTPSPSPSLPSVNTDGETPAAIVMPSPTASPIATPTEPPRESRLVIFGNSAFATDAFFGAQLNGDMFLNSVTWVSQADGQALSIRPREIKRRQLSATPQQVQIVILLSAVLLPILGFGLAALIGWRRR